MQDILICKNEVIHKSESNYNRQRTEENNIPNVEDHVELDNILGKSQEIEIIVLEKQDDEEDSVEMDIEPHRTISRYLITLSNGKLDISTSPLDCLPESQFQDKFQPISAPQMDELAAHLEYIEEEQNVEIEEECEEDCEEEGEENCEEEGEEEGEEDCEEEGEEDCEELSTADYREEVLADTMYTILRRNLPSPPPIRHFRNEFDVYSNSSSLSISIRDVDSRASNLSNMEYLINDELTMGANGEVVREEREGITSVDRGDIVNDDIEEIAREDRGEIVKGDIEEIAREERGKIIKDERGEMVREEIGDVAFEENIVVQKEVYKEIVREDGGDVLSDEREEKRMRSDVDDIMIDKVQTEMKIYDSQSRDLELNSENTNLSTEMYDCNDDKDSLNLSTSLTEYGVDGNQSSTDSDIELGLQKEPEIQLSHSQTTGDELDDFDKLTIGKSYSYGSFIECEKSGSFCEFVSNQPRESNSENMFSELLTQELIEKEIPGKNLTFNVKEVIENQNYFNSSVEEEIEKEDPCRTQEEIHELASIVHPIIDDYSLINQLSVKDLTDILRDQQLTQETWSAENRNFINSIDSATSFSGEPSDTRSNSLSADLLNICEDISYMSTAYHNTPREKNRNIMEDMHDSLTKVGLRGSTTSESDLQIRSEIKRRTTVSALCLEGGALAIGSEDRQVGSFEREETVSCVGQLTSLTEKLLTGAALLTDRLACLCDDIMRTENIPPTPDTSESYTSNASNASRYTCMENSMEENGGYECSANDSSYDELPLDGLKDHTCPESDADPLSGMNASEYSSIPPLDVGILLPEAILQLRNCLPVPEGDRLRFVPNHAPEHSPNDVSEHAPNDVSEHAPNDAPTLLVCREFSNCPRLYYMSDGMVYPEYGSFYESNVDRLPTTVNGTDIATTTHMANDTITASSVLEDTSDMMSPLSEGSLDGMQWSGTDIDSDSLDDERCDGANDDPGFLSNIRRNVTSSQEYFKTPTAPPMRKPNENNVSIASNHKTTTGFDISTSTSAILGDMMAVGISTNHQDIKQHNIGVKKDESSYMLSEIDEDCLVVEEVDSLCMMLEIEEEDVVLEDVYSSLIYREIEEEHLVVKEVDSSLMFRDIEDECLVVKEVDSSYMLSEIEEEDVAVKDVDSSSMLRDIEDECLKQRPPLLSLTTYMKNQLLSHLNIHLLSL